MQFIKQSSFRRKQKYKNLNFYCGGKAGTDIEAASYYIVTILS